MTILSNVRAANSTAITFNGNQTLSGTQLDSLIVKGDLTVTGDFIAPSDLYVEGRLIINATSFYVGGDLTVIKDVTGTMTGGIIVVGNFDCYSGQYGTDVTTAVTSSAFNYYQEVTTVGTPTWDGMTTVVTLNTSINTNVVNSPRLSPFTTTAPSFSGATATTLEFSSDVTASYPNGTVVRVYGTDNTTTVILGTGGANSTTFLTSSATDRRFGFAATRIPSATNYYRVTGDVEQYFPSGASVNISTQTEFAPTPVAIQLTSDGTGKMSIGKDFMIGGSAGLTNILDIEVKGNLAFQGPNVPISPTPTLTLTTTSGIPANPDGSFFPTYRGPNLTVHGDLIGFSVTSTPRSDSSYSGKAGDINIMGSFKGLLQSVSITANGANSSSVSGGNGGSISVLGGCFGVSNLNSFGGNYVGSGSGFNGGNGANISISGDIISSSSVTIASNGGNVTSSSASNGLGGSAAQISIRGNISVDTLTINSTGGNTAASGISNGGASSSISITGSITTVNNSTISSNGGSTTNSSNTGSGSSGSSITINGNTNNVATFNAFGGSANSATSSSGGAGGTITIKGNVISTSDGNIRTYGGATSGTGAAGTGANITINGNLIFEGGNSNINAYGGNTPSSSNNAGGGGSVFIYGNVRCGSQINLQGGNNTATTGNVRGGTGGTFSVQGSAQVGALNSSGGTTSSSGASQSGSGGQISITGYFVGSTITSTGSNLPSGAGPSAISTAGSGGIITLFGGGSLTSITNNGGVNNHTDSAFNRLGGAGGSVTFRGTFFVNGNISMSGGNSTGSTTGRGGASGTATFNGSNGIIMGSISTIGGNSHATQNGGAGTGITLNGHWTVLGNITMTRGTGLYSGTSYSLTIGGQLYANTINVSSEYFITSNSSAPSVLRVSSLTGKTTLTDASLTTSTAAISSPGQKSFMYDPNGTGSKWYALTGTLI